MYMYVYVSTRHAKYKRNNSRTNKYSNSCISSSTLMLLLTELLELSDVGADTSSTYHIQTFYKLRLEGPMLNIMCDDTASMMYM